MTNPLRDEIEEVIVEIIQLPRGKTVVQGDYVDKIMALLSACQLKLVDRIEKTSLKREPLHTGLTLSPDPRYLNDMYKLGMNNGYYKAIEDQRQSLGKIRKELEK